MFFDPFLELSGTFPDTFRLFLGIFLDSFSRFSGYSVLFFPEDNKEMRSFQTLLPISLFTFDSTTITWTVEANEEVVIVEVVVPLAVTIIALIIACKF